MNICVTSEGTTLDSSIDPRFGRCRYFLIVDSESMEFEAVENSGAAQMGGAGIESARLVTEKDVKVVLTGNCGPNAFNTLNAADIEVYVGLQGSIREAVEQYKSGKLKPLQGPSVESHFGRGK